MGVDGARRARNSSPIGSSGSGAPSAEICGSTSSLVATIEESDDDATLQAVTPKEWPRRRRPTPEAVATCC
ncbi:MAG TPA: hypothetical protein VIA06_10175 [Candidatus Dormibacteraeota bacterium]|nr:hypothetical protein [Candidatus Dormibacteraeota bacterium]